jgi:hypothetical protein
MLVYFKGNAKHSVMVLNVLDPRSSGLAPASTVLDLDLK